MLDEKMATIASIPTNDTKRDELMFLMAFYISVNSNVNWTLSGKGQTTKVDKGER